MRFRWKKNVGLSLCNTLLLQFLFYLFYLLISFIVCFL